MIVYYTFLKVTSLKTYIQHIEEVVFWKGVDQMKHSKASDKACFTGHTAATVIWK